MKKMDENVLSFNKEKLKGNKIGVFFGTFAPFHVGHQSEVYKALADNDGVLIITSGFSGDRGDNIGLPLMKRFRYLRKAFFKEKNVGIAYLNEDNIPKMPKGWDVWLKKLVSIIEKNINNKKAKITFYTGEKNYKKEIEKRLGSNSQFRVFVMDRSILNISATRIRKEPFKYWNCINPIFRRNFTKKILFVDFNSIHKTTLKKGFSYLTNLYCSSNYLPFFLREENISLSEMNERDYLKVIKKQFWINEKSINSPYNNGFVMFSSSIISLQAYFELFFSKKVFNDLKSVFKKMVSKENLDLIVISSPPEKIQNHSLFKGGKINSNIYYQKLLNLISYYHLSDRLIFLSSKEKLNKKAYDYYENYLKFLKIIKKYTNFDFKKFFHLSN